MPRLGMRKLGVSNLAWPARAETAALTMLAERGAQGVEVAPTRIAPWDEITPQRLADFRHGCTQAGLVVSSLQAIFYGRPDASLLGDEAGFSAMGEQVRRIAGIAHALGAGVAVFGAPNNRLRGALAPEEAMRRGAERLRRLGDLAAAGGVVLGMEPVPPVYGADFLNHDTACVSLAGDDVSVAIRAAAPLLAHYHVAEPQLGPFTRPVCDHALAGATLDAVGYAGWVVIEMREVEGPDRLDAIATALDYARAHYLGAAVS